MVAVGCLLHTAEVLGQLFVVTPRMALALRTGWDMSDRVQGVDMW